MSARPGCVTGLGLLAAVLVLVAVFANALFAGQVMFSPGDLNSRAAAHPLGGVRSHAELGKECGACHAPYWEPKTMGDRCVACHDDVGAQIGTRSGLHGRLVEEAPRASCALCHPEHNGPDGLLTRINDATFPHDVTPFSLESHRRAADGGPFSCADCHPAGVTEFDQAACVDCHTRIDATFMRGHLAAWGRVCQPCHDGTGRNGAGFDHNKLRFKLEGKHAGVACEKCHPSAKSLDALQATPRECIGCHRKDDKHAGAYGEDCSACHTTVTWKNATFDHKTFPLGHGAEEMKATCKTCHPRTTKSYDCYGCHEHTRANVAQEHQGEVQGDITDCIRCHKGGRKED